MQVDRLKRLVDQYKTSGLGQKINWNQISQELNRSYKDCSNKWRLMTEASLKKGPFTPEEDAIIVERVKQWGNKGKGLWVALEKELGRSSLSIRNRWTQILAKKFNPERADY